MAEELVDPSRPLYRSMPVTTALCAAYLLADVLLNSAEIVLHGLFPDRLAAWLSMSRAITTLTAKYVPAIDYVSSFLSHSPVPERAAFFQNVITMNWLLVAGFGVPCTITLLIESFQHRNIFVRRMRYTMDQIPALTSNYLLLMRNRWWVKNVIQNKVGYFLLELAMFTLLFFSMFFGGIFFFGPSSVYGRDPYILFIAFLFIGLGMFYLLFLTTFANVLLAPRPRATVK